MVEPAIGQAIANHLIDHGRKVAALLGRHAVALLAKLDFVLPQTFKIILPPLCNQALNLVKNTSVLALVAGGDLMYRSDNFVSLYGYLQGYIVCCLMYFIICFPLAMLVQWLERRSKERPRGVSLAELALDNVEEA